MQAVECYGKVVHKIHGSQFTTFKSDLTAMEVLRPISHLFYLLISFENDGTLDHNVIESWDFLDIDIKVDTFLDVEICVVNWVCLKLIPGQ